MKRAKHYQHWSAADMQTVRRMFDAGEPDRAIAVAVERSLYGVEHIRWRLGLCRPTLGPTLSNEMFELAAARIPAWSCHSDAKRVRDDMERIDAARDARDAEQYPEMAAEYAEQAARWRGEREVA